MFYTEYSTKSLLQEIKLKVIKLVLSLFGRFVLLSFVVVQWTVDGVTLETGASAVQHAVAAL